VDRIIDGYNLLPFSPAGRQRYGPGQLERARLRLLKWVATRLTEAERQATTIVFDGREAPGQGLRTQSIREIRVIYSATGQEADDVIEQLIARHPHPDKLVVVSSDARLRRAIQRRRGTHQESPEFIDLLESRRVTGDANGEPVRDEKPDQELSATELEEWLKAFEGPAELFTEPPPPRTVSPNSSVSPSAPASPPRRVENQPRQPPLTGAERERPARAKQISEKPTELEDLQLQPPVPLNEPGMQSLAELESALDQILREEGLKNRRKSPD
jgi:predicted RNA-binding protein with PIN domain